MADSDRSNTSQRRRSSSRSSRQGEEDTWQRSPYTYSRWDNGLSEEPIFVEVVPSLSSHDTLSEIYPDLAEGSQNVPTQAEIYGEDAADGEDVVRMHTSRPPVSHMGDFPQMHPWKVHRADEESFSSDDDDDMLLVESNNLRDDRTLFGRVFTSVTVTESQSMFFQANKEQTVNAVKLLDKVTFPPLSGFWHGLTQVFFLLVFFTNIVVACVDIGLGPSYLNYKIPALIVSVLENLILLALWLYYKSKHISEDDETSIKHQQYAENILHEILLYPSIIVSVLGVTTEQMYTKPSGSFGWVQITLMILDICDLVWTQCVRMYMAYRFFKDLQRVLVVDAGTISGKSFAGTLVPRVIFTTIGNQILFLFLIFVMATQMNSDNLTTSDYRMTLASWVMALALTFLPIISLVLFFYANSYWFLELLISMNVKVAQDVEFRKSLQDQYGAPISDALHFAIDKASSGKTQLEHLQSMPGFKKVLYGLSELHLVALFVIWEVLIVAVWLLFSGFTATSYLWSVKAIFIIFAVVINGHVFLLVMALNVSLPLFVVGIISYPITVLFCFKKKSKINEDEDEEFQIFD